MLPEMRSSGLADKQHERMHIDKDTRLDFKAIDSDINNLLDI